MNDLREKLMPVDRNQKALEYFKYTQGWIERHWDCKTCNKTEWKNVAKYLSLTIMKLLETGDFIKVCELEKIEKEKKSNVDRRAN